MKHNQRILVLSGVAETTKTDGKLVLQAVNTNATMHHLENFPTLSQ